MKKLEKIQELETKIKRSEIQPNEEQLGKLAGKAAVQAEIDDVKSYLTLYNNSQQGNAESEAAMKKQHAKELYKSKEGAVRCVANMIVMHTLMESGQKIPDELEEGVKHFSEMLNSVLGNTSGPLNWRKERDVFINACKKLVTSSKDVIEHTDISYEDLATGVAESISSNAFPETLEMSKPEPTAAEAEPEQEDEPEEEEAQVEPEVEEEKAPAEELVPEEEVVVPEEETPAEEEVQEQSETKPDEATEATEETPAAEGEEEDSKRGRGGRGRGRGQRGDRGNRGERGAFRGERGAYRGERGAREDRGDRGRGGRGRGQNWRGRNGEDNEGFITVKEDGDTSGRGRGRGNRGYRGGERGRGERGAWRGDAEGASRGGPRPPRGDRPPRTRAQKPDGDLPGVATAVTEPTPIKE